jgi:hypothetical protein
MRSSTRVEPEFWRAHIPVMAANPNKLTETAPKQPEEKPVEVPPRPKEIGGPKGPEPTRYGDWQYNGRCTDF